MAYETISLSKIEAAERQLKQCIRMFFKEEDPVSIRTLAEAAGEVLSDIGDYQGIVRDKKMIKPERYREWLKAIFEDRNFFKHGKKDSDRILEFKPIMNDIVILDAVTMHMKYTKNWTIETLLYQIWNQLNYPDFWYEDHPIYKAVEGKSYSSDCKEKSFMRKIIKAIDNGEVNFSFPEIKSIES
ncbi:TPA: hypothetical protein R4Y05_003255 [Serratia liquefaciens]|nr:hypothetical protein [Serratia liquefaciens]